MSSPLISVTTSSGLVIPLRTDLNTTIDLSTFTSATDWLREIPKLSSHVMSTFNNDRVVQAAQLLTNCITTSERLMSSATEQQKHELQQHIDEMKNGDQFTYVRDVETELQALRISCREEKGQDGGVEWTKLDEHAGITTWYRKDPSYATHSFKVSGEVSAPLFNLIAIVYEIDLFAHWLPAIHSSTKLCHIDGSRFRMLAQMMIDVPWPVTNREVLFYGYGDVLDREVAIYFRSIRPTESFTTTEPVQTSTTSSNASTPTSSPPSSSEPRSVELPPCPPKHVRCEVRQGGFIIHPIDANRSKVTVLFNIDPKLSLIPYWFLNMISSKFCYVLIELMRKNAPKLGPEFDSRIATNRRVYGEIERRLAEVEPQDGKKEGSNKEDHTNKEKKSISKQSQHQSISKQAHAKADDNDDEEYDIVYHDANSPSPK